LKKKKKDEEKEIYEYPHQNGEICVTLRWVSLGLCPGFLASDVVEVSVVTGRRRYMLSNGVRLVSGGVLTDSDSNCPSESEEPSSSY